MKILTILAPIATIFNVIYNFLKDIFKKNKNDNNKMSNNINTNVLGNNNITNQGSNNSVTVHNGDNNFSAPTSIGCIVQEEQKIPLTFKQRQITRHWFDAATLFMVLTLILLLSFNKLIEQTDSTGGLHITYLLSMVLSFFLTTYFFHWSAKIHNNGVFHTLFCGLLKADNGKLYKIKYKGTCLLCNGKIEVKVINRKLMAQCLIYRDEHIFPFTPRIFDKENCSS